MVDLHGKCSFDSFNLVSLKTFLYGYIKRHTRFVDVCSVAKSNSWGRG